MIQGSSLRVLACYHNTDSLNFADLCNQSGFPTDLGGYYIRGLVREGFLEKGSRGQYNITPKGKQQIALSYGKRLYEQNPRLAVIVVATKQDKFAVIKRSVQPFIGSVEWPAVSVRLGESLNRAAERALKDRLGSTAKLEFIGFFRRIDTYESTTFDDKLFAVHRVHLPEGSELLEENAVGKVALLSRGELLHVENPAKSLLDIFSFVEKASAPAYEEHDYTIEISDLAK